MSIGHTPPSPVASTFASLFELREIQAQLGERHRQEAENSAFWGAIDEFVQRGCATGVLLDDEDER